MPRIIKNLYTCPKCGHSVGWRRRLSANIFSIWPCKNCGTPLGFGSVRSLILVSIFTFSTALWLKPHVNFWVFWVIFASGMIFAGYVDPVVEKHEPQRPDAE